MSIINYFIDFIGKLGYIGVTIVVGLEYACIPMPSEVILPFIGLTAAQGEFTYIGALTSSILGGVLGSSICYYIGYFGGRPFLKWSISKFPKSNKSIKALNTWFEKYGKVAVLVARTIPMTRTYVSFLAGVERMKIGVFLFYSSIGIILWNTLLISLGYYLGDNLELIEEIMRRYSFLILIIVAIGIIGYILMRSNKNKLKQS